MPQIEVTFDIDANGILNVTAKDKGTGKEQTIRIESSSGLSKDEVERMRRDAEAHAAEDKQRRELVDLKNQAEQIVHETEKQLDEHKDKLPADDLAAIEAAKEALKQAAQGEDRAALEKALATFQQKAQKLGEILYRQHAEAPKGPAGEPSPADRRQGLRRARRRRFRGQDLGRGPGGRPCALRRFRPTIGRPSAHLEARPGPPAQHRPGPCVHFELPGKPSADGSPKAPSHDRAPFPWRPPGTRGAG